MMIALKMAVEAPTCSSNSAPVRVALFATAPSIRVATSSTSAPASGYTTIWLTSSPGSTASVISGGRVSMNISCAAPSGTMAVVSGRGQRRLQRSDDLEVAAADLDRVAGHGAPALAARRGAEHDDVAVVLRR